MIEAPERFGYYCRTCIAVTPHLNEGRRIRCTHCNRTVHSVEVIATYSTNDYHNEMLSLPKELRYV